MFIRTIAASAIALLATGAQASTVFSDNFNTNSAGLNAIPTGWGVTTGTVDVIGQGFFDFLTGNGLYLDLDGSSSDAGLLSRSFGGVAGVEYTATFVLAGSQRGDINDVTVTLGSTSQIYVLNSGDGRTTYSLSYTPTADGSVTLSFENAGGDNFGALLDDVSVTAVPEPGSVALAMAGLSVAGVLARRRRA